MKITNDNLSFQSRIKFINNKQFEDRIKNLNPKRHEVGWPWTADTMKLGKNLYTTKIMDCITGGVVDGKRIAMFHLGIYNQNKARKYNQKGLDIENIKRRILEKINLNNEDLHGIILGGFQLEPTDKYNVNVLNKIRKFFDEYHIPYTIFGARKDVHYFGEYSLFYSGKEDTFYITNNLVGTRALSGKGFEIDIQDNSIAYNTYEKTRDKYGVKYKCIRNVTDTIKFFESQFRQVSVSKTDTLI